ncbi:antitoxin Xre/MbcA/ParS toxin-binding domain-containing protein [Cupriavidus pauculus]|jgi:putative toxin-antitoxin system antitoxin component (TIGR02293 family)|nr:antitoxin Xre/MbcA/ParS toxin-binding domain-containing protein [Cupriavidus pauculus]
MANTSTSAPSATGLGTQPDDFDVFLKQMGALEQRQVIREGMNAVMVERVARELLRVPVQTLLSGLGLPSSTMLRKMSKQERLSAPESDKVARVLYVHELATDVLEDATLASQWMQKPLFELDGMKPLEVLDSQPGYDRVRDILTRAAFGIPV